MFWVTYLTIAKKKIMTKSPYLAAIVTMIFAVALLSAPAGAGKPQKEVDGQIVYVGKG